MAWRVEAVDLPYADAPQTWWVGADGMLGTVAVDDADLLPGAFVLRGLVDAHAHPAISAGAAGPVAAGEAATRHRLRAWADAGVAVVRDVGSPGGVILDLMSSGLGPRVQAAGRFLAPAHRYYQELLVDPVSTEGLRTAALREVARGATWVKIIGDFPLVPADVDNAMTYPIDVVAGVVTAVHDVGARVAVHTVLPGAAAAFVASGVDSIEHGPAIDRQTLGEMARRGTAWTPTLCAVFGLLDEPDLSAERRDALNLARESLAELLPEAVRLGVPVLAGTDVVGTISREVALLASLGLEPKQALASASESARAFLGDTAGHVDLVTYAHDPREDPSQLDRPWPSWWTASAAADSIYLRARKRSIVASPDRLLLSGSRLVGVSAGDEKGMPLPSSNGST